MTVCPFERVLFAVIPKPGGEGVLVGRLAPSKYQSVGADGLFAIEREINGMTPRQRVRLRNERSRSLVIDLPIWMSKQRREVGLDTATRYLTAPPKSRESG